MAHRAPHWNAVVFRCVAHELADSPVAVKRAVLQDVLPLTSQLAKCALNRTVHVVDVHIWTRCAVYLRNLRETRAHHRTSRLVLRSCFVWLGTGDFFTALRDRAAENGFRPRWKSFFFGHTSPSQARVYQHGEEQGNKARWPQAASAVVTTNHYQITSDTTGKQKHLQHGRPR